MVCILECAPACGWRCIWVERFPRCELLVHLNGCGCLIVARWLWSCGCGSVADSHVAMVLSGCGCVAVSCVVLVLWLFPAWLCILLGLSFCGPHAVVHFAMTLCGLLGGCGCVGQATGLWFCTWV